MLNAVWTNSAGGRWPRHKITKNLCAPFIHSFIVDEWETTNLNRRVLVLFNSGF